MSTIRIYEVKIKHYFIVSIRTIRFTHPCRLNEICSLKLPIDGDTIEKKRRNHCQNNNKDVDNRLNVNNENTLILTNNLRNSDIGILC